MLLPSEVLWLILVMCCVQGSQYITVMTNTFTDLSGGFIKLGSVFTNVRRLVSYLAVCVSVFKQLEFWFECGDVIVDVNVSAVQAAGSTNPADWDSYSIVQDNTATNMAFEFSGAAAFHGG